MNAPTIVVLHGITMSGASMLRTLGPLRQRLEAAGFALVAPNAGHRLGDAELAALTEWMTARYRDTGQTASGDFSDGRFWNAGEHYDFKPAFDAPNLFAYPAGPLPRLLAIGARDPIFPSNAEYLASMSRAFEGGGEALVVVPELGHDVPSNPEVVERLVKFVLDGSAV